MSPYCAAFTLSELFRDGVDDVAAADAYRKALRSPSGDVQCESGCFDRVGVINDFALVLDRLGEHGEAVDLLREAVMLAPDSIQAAGNLAVYLRDLGDIPAAVAAGRRGLSIAPDSVPMMHNVALIEHKAGNVDRAIELWWAAHNAAPDVYHPVASLAHHEGYRGNVSGAKSLYATALAIAERTTSADVDALRLQLATSVVPHIYESTQHAVQVHDEYVTGLKALLDRGTLSINDPPHSTGSGARASGVYDTCALVDSVTLSRAALATTWSTSAPPTSCREDCWLKCTGVRHRRCAMQRRTF